MYPTPVHDPAPVQYPMLVLEELVLQPQLLLVAPLSPLDTKMVTPRSPSFMASLLNAVTLNGELYCSLEPHEIEREVGGLTCAATWIKKFTKESSVIELVLVPFTYQYIATK